MPLCLLRSSRNFFVYRQPGTARTARLGLCLLCALLFLALAPLPSMLSCAHAGDSANETVNALLSLLDGTGKRKHMESLDVLRKAGFGYEKHLVLPAKVDMTCKDRDERNVIAGMHSVDWDYALFFGQQASRGSCIMPFSLGKTRITARNITDKEWKIIKANPGGLQAREIMVQISMNFQRKMLEAGRKDHAALQALGARHYGATLESLYITIILVLAAEESDSMEYLKKLHAGSFARQNQVLEVLLRNKQLGDMEYFRERAELVRRVLNLLEKNHGKPGLKDLAAVLEIIQPERDRYLAPCPGK